MTATGPHLSQNSTSDSSQALCDFSKCLPLLHRSQAEYECLHGESPSLQRWTAASLVILDVAALKRCLDDRLPERAKVVLVTSPSLASTPFVAATRLGVQHVVQLPTQSRGLSQTITQSRVEQRANYQLLVLLGRIVWP